MIYGAARYHRAAAAPRGEGREPRGRPGPARGGRRQRGAAGHKEARPLRQNGLGVREGASP